MYVDGDLIVVHATHESWPPGWLRTVAGSNIDDDGIRVADSAWPVLERRIARLVANRGYDVEAKRISDPGDRKVI